MSLLDDLPHRCTIFRQTRSNDSLGGNKYGVVIEKTNVEVWEQQASASEIQDYEKRGIVVNTKLYFVEDPKVTERHSVLITKRLDVNSPNLSVTDVSNPDVVYVKSDTRPDASAGLGILWRVMCEKKTSRTQ